MASISSTVLVAGNLTRDPEVRSLTSGKSVVKVSIAANPRQFDREKNEWVDGEPVYWEGVAFDKLADNIAASFTKGDRVMMSGTVKSDSWNDKESGVKKTKMVVQIDEIGKSVLWEPLGGRAAAQSAPAQEESWASGFGDDTPF